MSNYQINYIIMLETVNDTPAIQSAQRSIV